MSRPMIHRRRNGDASIVTIIHGANADCPDVRAGRADRCPGHHPEPVDALVLAIVPEEGPLEHLRNALAVIRCTLDCGEPVVDDDGPSVVVPLRDLARLQARIETTLSLLELDGRAVCLACGGTILPPTCDGVPRGTCHCRNGDGRTLASDIEEDR